MSELSERPICDICGLSSPLGAATCFRCGLSFEVQARASLARGGFLDTDAAEFAYRPAATGTDIFKAAEALFLSQFFFENSPGEMGYERDQVFENEDTFYFPVGWIGCCGHLVSKSPLRLVSFGSCIGPGANIWAYYQGISMAPLGKDRLNDFRILSINNMQNTVRVLKTFLDSRWVASELVPGLSSLPIEISGIDLYFGIAGLLEAKKNDWFRFEVSK